MADLGIVLAMLACLTSGLAAVVVAPSNRAGQALLVAGIGVTAFELLAPVVRDAPATASGGLLIRRSEQSPLRLLTPRELEVLREMAQGRTNAAIAQALFISESAVSKHITAIFGKLGLAEDTLIDRRVSAVLTYVTAVEP